MPGSAKLKSGYFKRREAVENWISCFDHGEIGLLDLIVLDELFAQLPVIVAPRKDPR